MPENADGPFAAPEDSQDFGIGLVAQYVTGYGTAVRSKLDGIGYQLSPLNNDRLEDDRRREIEHQMQGLNDNQLRMLFRFELLRQEQENGGAYGRPLRPIYEETRKLAEEHKKAKDNDTKSESKTPAEYLSSKTQELAQTLPPVPVTRLDTSAYEKAGYTLENVVYMLEQTNDLVQVLDEFSKTPEQRLYWEGPLLERLRKKDEKKLDEWLNNHPHEIEENDKKMLAAALGSDQHPLYPFAEQVLSLSRDQQFAILPEYVKSHGNDAKLAVVTTKHGAQELERSLLAFKAIEGERGKPLTVTISPEHPGEFPFPEPVLAIISGDAMRDEGFLKQMRRIINGRDHADSKTPLMEDKDRKLNNEYEMGFRKFLEEQRQGSGVEAGRS